MDPSTVANTPPPPLALAQNIHAQILGNMFDWFLFGALIIQTWTYVTTFPDDSFRLKALVYFLVIMETARTIILTSYILDQYGTNYGVYSHLHHLGINWIGVPVLASISCVFSMARYKLLIRSLVNTTVQFFLTWRVWTLGRNWVVTVVILLFATAHGSAGVTAGIITHLQDDWTKSNANPIKTVGTIWMTSAAIADVLIAAATVFYLSKMRTGFQKTENVLNRLILMIIETGSATALSAVIMMALFFGVPDRTYFLALSFAMSKLYSNNILLIQNHRERMKTVLADSGFASGGHSRFVAAIPPHVDNSIMLEAGRQVTADGVDIRKTMDISGDGSLKYPHTF
ncbi:hypothetical protein DL96DRAFT_1717304 [Flagelloscypha sp. PMI_526]|nr:hypothetical protein DL96DRAFT_1717304 [Flagelloscypha sp. PMI_526]